MICDQEPPVPRTFDPRHAIRGKKPDTPMGIWFFAALPEIQLHLCIVYTRRRIHNRSVWQFKHAYAFSAISPVLQFHHGPFDIAFWQKI